MPLGSLLADKAQLNTRPSLADTNVQRDGKPLEGHPVDRLEVGCVRNLRVEVFSSSLSLMKKRKKILSTG